MKLLRLLGTFAVTVLLLAFCFSCEIGMVNHSKEPDGPAKVTADIVWSRVTGSTDNQPMLIHDNVLFYAESHAEVDGYTALNPETGDIIWQDTGRGTAYCLPIFFQNGLIGYINGKHTYLFHSDGTFFRHIQLEHDDYRVSNGAAFGTKIVFATKAYGMIYYDIYDDVELREGTYYAKPTIIYPNPPDEDGDNDIRWITPLVRDGILYSGVHPVWVKPGTFFAINLTTNATLWETKGKYLDAWSNWPMTYLGGRLVQLDPYGFGIIDAASGKLLVEHGVYYAGGKYAGGYFYEGKVYYTNGSTAENEDTPNNVICMDTSTGEAVWMQSFEGSHGSNPVCYRGITYVFSQNCMRVLDANTGQLLGVDPSIRGDKWQIANIVTYGDLAIVKYFGRIYAVRMNFRTDGKGKLWKE